jgi:peptidyl-prolyl cis-trans isomerase SurA
MISWWQVQIGMSSVEKYSDDQRTKNNGGTLPFIGLRQINDEAFESAAFNLQNPGEISDPVRSRFGWHIIRLEEKQGLQPFEELKEELEQKVSVRVTGQG